MERPLQIAFKNVESSASLETLIRERVERLQRFHPHITGARVVVEVPHRSPESGKLPLGIAVEIDVPGRNTVIAKGEQDRRELKGDRSAIVNRVFEAAERQLEQISAIRKGEVKQHGSVGDTGDRRAHLPRAELRLHRGEGFARPLFLERCRRQWIASSTSRSARSCT